MTSWPSLQSATTARFDAGELRALIAEHLGVDIARVTDEAHFRDDLRADWLDRIELMIAVEDRFVEVEITDDDADQICAVGDLIRHVESVMAESAAAPRCRRRGGAPAVHELWAAAHHVRRPWKARTTAPLAGW
jgi:acyl carrier protein